MKRTSDGVRKEEEKEVEKPITFNLSWPSDESRQALSSSAFQNIPNEILLLIFGFMSVRDLRRISLVCRTFKMLVDHDEIWERKCDRTKRLRSKSYKQLYIEWIQEKSRRNRLLMRMRAYDASQREREFSRNRQESIWNGGGERTACIGHSSFRSSSRYPSPRSLPKLIYGFRSPSDSKSGRSFASETTLNVSVNIDETIPKMILLLEKASKFQQQWYQPAILKQMIQRYYRFMQLKASHPSNTLLIPTLDIEIIWQTHLLRPEMYEKDCHRLFRRIIDHSLILNIAEDHFKEQAFNDTCQLYKEKFGEKYCSSRTIEENKPMTSYSFYTRYNISDRNISISSYWDKTYFKFSSKPPEDYENPFSFTEGDVILDGNWLDSCQQFMSKAIKKHPDTDRGRSNSSTKIDLGSRAIERLKKSYERFLQMAAKYPPNRGKEFIPPTYAIDIIWHSHMQEPLNYVADCRRLIGYVLYHDPWPIVEDEKMKKSCDKVNQIWRDEFQHELDTDHLY